MTKNADVSFRQVLLLLWAIQFFSWSAMFALWICAVPFIAGPVLHLPMGATDALRPALVTVSLCFAAYATLGALGGLVLPKVIARFGHGLTYAAGLALGAAGLALLSQARGVAMLVPAFIAIGLGWGVIGALPYAILGKLAPAGRGAHYTRLFGFSMVLPQVVTTLFLVLFASRWLGAGLDRELVFGAASMAVAALLAFAGRAQFSPADAVEEDW